MSKTLFYILSVILFVGVLGGCATETQTPGPGQAGSDLPWNAPASWEGQGQLGSALGH